MPILKWHWNYYNHYIKDNNNMKIKGNILKAIQAEVDSRLAVISEKTCKEYYQNTCIPKAIKSPIDFFTGNFISCYNTAIEKLELPIYGNGFNDDHIFTALRHCLKNNTKTNFIFK